MTTQFPTVFELAKEVRMVDDTGKIGKGAKSIVVGMKPKPFDTRPGLRRLSPEQLLSVEIPQVARLNGRFIGFQRDLRARHSRAIADALEKDREVPEIQLSVVEGGRVLCTDGLHRSIAAVIARKPLRAVVTKRTEEQARQLFADQDRSMKVDPNVLILASDDAISEYVQEAITGPGSVWSQLVGQTASQNRISPSQMAQLVANYNDATLQGHRKLKERHRVVLDVELGEEMGSLLAAFGTKQTNPMAFTPKSLNAISATAVLVIRRRGRSAEDIARWGRWMPQFQFAQYQHLRRHVEVTDALLDHWNKRLKAPHRVWRREG